MKKGMTLEDVYRERTSLYEKYADIILDGDETTIEECVEMLVKKLEQTEC